MAPADRQRLTAQREKGPCRLIVEGVDDKFTVISLISRHGIDWDASDPALPFVEDATGVDKLLSLLPLATRTRERLGIVIDMDDPEDQDRWAQIRDRLRAQGVAAPDTPASDGTIVPGLRGASSRIGVWIMPDNRNAGALEHFVSTLIPEDDPCFSHAESATQQARALGAPLAEKDHLKGAIRAWLAWRAQPGVPFGTALTSKYLRHDSEEALRFLAWFKKLFLEPVEGPDGRRPQG